MGRHYELLSVGRDAKTIKGENLGVRTACLGLAPYTLAGGINLCPHSTPGCRAVCIHEQGRAKFCPNVKPGRLAKTQLFLNDPDRFFRMLAEDLDKFVIDCEEDAMEAHVRLNWMSDIRWERYGIPQAYPELQFYDYTKWPYEQRQRLPNYHLTYSLNEHSKSWTRALRYIKEGCTVAVVFCTVDQVLDAVDHGFRGLAVCDGDVTDVRSWDQTPIVGLKAKGSGRFDDSGFVIDYDRTVHSIPTMAVLEMALQVDQSCVAAK